MKKYFVVTGILNVLLSFPAFYFFVSYLVLSASKMYSTIVDLLVLLSVVLIDVLINAIIYKILKQKDYIYILIPSSLFMFCSGLLFLIK